MRSLLIRHEGGGSWDSIYDIIGCSYNMPAAYQDDVFLSCEGDLQDEVGTYTSDGQSEYHSSSPTVQPHVLTNSHHVVPTLFIVPIHNASLEAPRAIILQLHDVPIDRPLSRFGSGLPRQCHLERNIWIGFCLCDCFRCEWRGRG